MELHINENFALVEGALPSPRYEDDMVYEDLGKLPADPMGVFPSRFIINDYSMPARTQGNRGTCAAFVGAAIKEVQETGDSWLTHDGEPKRDEYMSPEFVYFHRVNKPLAGMSGRDVLRVLKEIGSVPERMYPYSNMDKLMETPEQYLYAVAANYKIAGYAKVTTIMGLKNALLDKSPGYILLPAYNTSAEFWRPPSPGARYVGHALTVVGFTVDGFILRNSWGKTWNNDGHTLIPYTDWSSVSECWVAIDELTGPIARVPSRKSRGKSLSVTM